MVHKCVVCCNNSKNNKDISFYQFPKDIPKNILWLKVLNLTSISHWHKVCSQHFKSSNLNFSNNRQIFHSTAVPIGNCNPFHNHSYAYGILSSSPTCLRFSNTTIISEVSDCLPCTSRTEIYEEIDIVNSQPFPFHLCTEVLSPPRKVKKIWNSSCLGDLKEDFSTPKRRKHNFSLVQNTVTSIRRKNKILNQRNQR